jgi:hypothetical protein
MYKFIVNPKTNQKVSIFSKLGKQILKNYKNIMSGGSSQNIKPHYIEINSIDFALKESISYFSNNINNLNLEIFKIFVLNKIKEDLHFINNILYFYETFDNLHSDKFSKGFKDTLDITLIKRQVAIINNSNHLKFKLFMKYYVQLYVIIFIKANITDNSKINNLQEEHNQYAYKINHPKIIINDFLDNYRGEINNFIRSFSYTDPTPNPLLKMPPTPFKHKLSPIISVNGGSMQRGGGDKYYKSISNILESIAEPIHDFGGSRSYANTFFTSNYNGTLAGEILKDTDIRNINNGLMGIKKGSGVTSWLVNFIFNCGLDITHLLKSSNLEPLLFNKLHINKLFLKEDDIMFLTKLKYFALKGRESNTFDHWIINSENDIKKGGDLTGFDIFINSILNTIKVNKFIYDTSSGMNNLTNVKAKINFEEGQLVPLSNLWDPASTAVSNFNNNIDKDVLIPELFMSSNLFPQRKFGANLGYNVELCDICVQNRVNCKTPLKLVLKNGYSESIIYLSKGFSVKELSIVMKKILEKQTYTNTTKLDTDLSNYEFDNDEYTNAKKEAFLKNITEGNNGHKIQSEKALLSYERVLLLINLIDTYNTTLTGGKSKRKSILIKLLLDFKKSGDWGLVNWVNEYNSQASHRNEKALLISGDKLCALKSIHTGNPTIFGSTRKLTDAILESEGDEIHLGIYMGKNFDITGQQVKLELDSYKNLLGNDFFQDSSYNLVNVNEFNSKFSEIYDVLYSYWNINLKSQLIEQNSITETIYNSADYITPFLHIYTGEDEDKNTILNNIYTVLNYNMEIINSIYDLLGADSVVPKKKKNIIEKAFNQCKTIINIFSPSQKFFMTNLSEIGDLLNQTLEITLTNIASQCFIDGDMSPIKSDLNKLFGDDSFFEQEKRKSNPRRSRRIISKMNSWLEDLTVNLSHIDASNPNCSQIFTDERISDEIDNISVWINKFLSKTLTLSKIQYAYETIPNIYNQLYTYIGEIDFNIGHSSKQEYINIINETLGYFMIMHYKVSDTTEGERKQGDPGGKNFEITNSNSIYKRVGSNPTLLNEPFNINAINKAISETNFLLKCIADSVKIYSDMNSDNEGIKKYVNSINNFSEFLTKMEIDTDDD